MEKLETNLDAFKKLRTRNEVTQKRLPDKKYFDPQDFAYLASDRM